MGIFDKLTERVGDFIEEVMLPDELHLQLERAERDIQQGDYDRALSALARVERAKPDLARAQHLMGRAHFLRGAPQEAARAFRRAIELKEEPQSHFWAGLCMERLEEWRAAEDHFRRSLAVGGERATFEFDLYLGLGRVALEMARPDKAIKELKRALKLMPDHVNASVTLARALLVRQQAHEAWTLLERVEHNLAGATAWLVQAEVAVATGRQERALEACQLLLTDMDARPDQRRRALVIALTIAIDRQQRGQALEWMSQLETLDRGDLDAPALVLKAKLMRMATAEAQITPILERAIARDPEHAQALVMLGQTLLEQGQPDQAQRCFQRALDVDAPSGAKTQDALALLGLGRCRLERKELTAARQLFEEALRLEGDSPGSAQAWLALAETELAQGDAARALLAIRQAQGLLGGDDAVAAQLTERALEQLRPTWEALPASADDAMSVGQVMTTMRDYIARDHRLVDFMPAIQEQLATLDAPLSIAIVGEFNAGKSTLINALLGEDMVPTGVLPTTAHTGIIQYGPRSSARVHYTDGRAEELSFERAKALMKSNAEEIAYLDYLYPHPELRAVHYWDTPGFNALEERHEVVAARALAQAEAILWVMDANQVLSQTEFERIESVPEGNQRLLVVINKIDRLGPKGFRDESVAQLVEYIEDYAGEHIAGCYPLSALVSLERHKLDEQERSSQPDDSGMEEFRQHLQTQIIERAGQIKTIEAKRHLSGLVITLSAFQHGLTKRYRALALATSQAQQELERGAIAHSEQRAQQELMTLEDRLDFMLRAVTKEIEEALKPSGSLMNTRMVLSEEDRAFIQQLLLERFLSLLEQSLERVFHDVVALEADVALKVGPIMHELSLQDSRAISQRLEGFRDELRMLKLLLKERVYGRAGARATGQIEAGSQQALKAIEGLSDPQRWRALLRALLPELRPGFRQDLIQWYQDFFAAAVRLLERVKNDLEVLKLEAQHRYDISPLELLILGEPLAPPPEAAAEDDEEQDLAL